MPGKFMSRVSSFIRADTMPFVENAMDNAGLGADLAGGAVVLGAAVTIPTLLNLWRMRKSPDRQKSGAADTAAPDEPPTSIFEFLADQLDRTENQRLDDAMAELVDELNPDEIRARLEEEVKEWSRNRPQGAGKPPSEAELVTVLQVLVQNAREAIYRERFADHYRRIVSIDRRDRSTVDQVFVTLQAESRIRESETEVDGRAEQWAGPEYLDFREKTPGEVETMLRGSGNLVILGSPGSGKSVLLRYLAATCAESGSEDALLPLFLRLRYYEQDRDLTLIAENASKFAETELQLPMPAGFFQNALRDGRCLVLLDALDEVPSEARYSVARRIEQLARNHPGCRFVVTSRIAAYDEAPLDETLFARYEVQPMEDSGITAFVNRRFGPDSAQATGLQRIFKTESAVRSLASNPLMLTIINLIYHESGRETGLSLKRAGFYKKAVEILIEDKDDEGRLVDADGREFFQNREDILAAIAHRLHLAGRETIEKPDLQRFVAQFLEGEIKVPAREARRQSEDFAELAEQRTGLLVRQEGGQGEFEFLHPTFREYLTAQHIRYSLPSVSSPETYWAEVKDHVTDPHWREVILFLLASLEEEHCTYLTSEILAAGDFAMMYERSSSSLNLDEWISSGLFMAANALTNQSRMTPQLQQEIIDRLSNAVRAGTFPRFAVVKDLCKITHIPHLVVPALRGLAQDLEVDASCRISTAQRLGELGEREAAIAVLNGLAQDPEVEAYDRAWAARELGELGERKTAIAVLGALAQDPAVHPNTRRIAALPLALLGERKTAIAVLGALAQDPAVRPIIRRNAAVPLALLGERKTAIAVLSALAQDPEVIFLVRLEAASELRELGERETAIAVAGALAQDQAVHPIIRKFAKRRLDRFTGESTNA